MPNVIIEQNVPCRLRDGVILYADVYRPAEEGRYPVLMTRTPYDKSTYLNGLTALMNPLRAAQAGYVAIVQDTRGRFTSEGQFAYADQLPQEGPDGYDAVEWAAALPYSDGNVGMFGVSYLAWTQWLAAMQRPPHLRAIAPSQAPVDVTNGTLYRGGALELGCMLNWHLGVCLEVVLRRLAAANATSAEVAAATQAVAVATDRLSAGGYEELPLRDLRSLRELGLSSMIAYLLDRGPGGQWREWNLDASLAEVPSLGIAGWYDIFVQTDLDTYVAMRQQGKPAHLLLGPWAHARYASTMGEAEFGLAADGGFIGLQEDLTAYQLRWFDHWLKGIDNGVDREPPVKLFLTGENRWLELPDWPPQEAQERSFYLQSDGTLTGSRPTSDSSASRYTYDPLNLAPTLGGLTLLPGIYPPGVKDQRPLSQRSDVLTFTGAPLDKPLTVMGRVAANLWVSSSAPDTDFVARLIDVHPDGYMENLCDGIQRARYRESPREPKWLEPGKAYDLKVDLWSTAHTFRAGHRIAMQVTSSSFPRWDRNWNTKENPGEATAGQAAEQTIWHDAERASRIVLPVMPE